MARVGAYAAMRMQHPGKCWRLSWLFFLVIQSFGLDGGWLLIYMRDVDWLPCILAAFPSIP